MLRGFVVVLIGAVCAGQEVERARVTLRNDSNEARVYASTPSLEWKLPAGPYTLYTLYGGWGQERQLQVETLGAGARGMKSVRGRSSALYSPWVALTNGKTGMTYAAQLAWSGNWFLSVEREPGRAAVRIEAQPVVVKMGLEFDNGGMHRLMPGESLELPEAAHVAVKGDLDDAANALHRYQRKNVFPRRPSALPPVQFNSWYPFPGKLTVAEMMRCADVAAKIGAEVFVLDSGWYNKKDWSLELGDYEADKEKFPRGIEELADHVRQRGMKFGIWVEIENAGIQSRLVAEHSDWFLKRAGKAMSNDRRQQLDFSKPEVRKWARGVVDRLVRDYKIEWIKIDYNIDAGASFDSTRPAPDGMVLARHVRAYYEWLDEIRTAYPGLWVENCSSGGLRFDNGIMAHTHSTWLSDEVLPLPSVQLAWGCTLEFAPEVCNHWMVGETHLGDVKPARAEWFDFMLRVPMNGQYGISSKVFEWPAGLMERAAENVLVYKRLRPVISEADVYHLTPAPDHNDPAGWMAIEYIGPGAARGAVLAYRLRGGEAVRTFKLRGLHAARSYRVSVDGKERELATGAKLMSEGLKLEAAADYTALIVELGPAK